MSSTDSSPRTPRGGALRTAIAVVRADCAKLLPMLIVVVGLYVLGIGLVAGNAAAHAGLISTATLAFTLGLRHAFDADHIAAIDNTTRKLRQDGQRPMSVGFFFSLGHATVVLVLTVIAAVITHAVPDIGNSTGFVGASVSGAFLWIVGLLNLAVLLDIVRVARRVRTETYGEEELEAMLAPKGMLTRLGLDRVMRFVTRPWQMAPVGLLFGLGFDTATEVALIALGTGAAAADLPVTAVLALPVLFAAGMCTMDTIDGVLMSHAYDWAFRRPARKIFYNLTITTLSVVVALAVGTVQLLTVAIQALDLRGGAWDTIANLDFQVLGYVIAGLFVATWLIALTLWRVLDLEARWTPDARALTTPRRSSGAGHRRWPARGEMATYSITSATASSACSGSPGPRCRRSGSPGASGSGGQPRTMTCPVPSLPPTSTSTVCFPTV